MKRKVLCLSSNSAMQFLLKTMLEKQFRIVPMADIYTAMQEFRKQGDFDMLIADISAGEKDHWNFVSHIAANPLYSAPVVVLTDKDNGAGEQHCVEAGVRHYFFKPFDPITLKQEVEKLLFTKTVNS